MSQVTRILGVKHSGGSVYLGQKSGNPSYTKNPEKIMEYLCDGWRFRFNQCRAQRVVRRKVDGEWIDTKLGKGASDHITDSQARKKYSWLTCMPGNVLNRVGWIEDKEWWSSLKRMSTNKTKGQEIGHSPGFKSLRQNGQTFVCYSDREQNANFRKTSKRTGIVTISGQTPRSLQRTGESCRWKLSIRVRVSQGIRPYTSVVVDWTKRKVVFVSPPPEREHIYNGLAVGLDMGVAKTVSDSNGEFYQIPRVSTDETNKLKGLQRKLARQDRIAKSESEHRRNSARREKTRKQINKLFKKQANRRKDFAHKLTTELVCANDLVAIEDLKIKNMSKSARGTINNPGKNVRQKAGLNRSIRESSWGMICQMLEYKSKCSGVELKTVNPAYTSQTCCKCGHIAKENRESQAIFLCVSCEHSANADTNAAENILNKALGFVPGQGVGPVHGENIRPVSSDPGSLNEVQTSALS